jgi:coproporphyrinogen III oxidase-like Fe-S oxidoreductase
MTRGESVEAAGETLDDEARRQEGLQLILRTRDGVPVDAFDAETRDVFDRLLVPHPNEPDRLVLTRAGRLLANEVAVRLADSAERETGSTDRLAGQSSEQG